MKISVLGLENIRGYKSSTIELSPKINLLVGENNSGKTTILKSLLLLQDTLALRCADVRTGQSEGSIVLKFTFVDDNIDILFAEPFNLPLYKFNSIKYELMNEIRMLLGDEFNNLSSTHLLQNCVREMEPDNFIYPFLSKRKVPNFQENVGQPYANSVLGNFAHISAKVDRISADGLPAKDEYIRNCREILGFHISSFPSPNGKKAGNCSTQRK
jgi:energy-coupling factor transporter ATP-binding protein EcfA2